MAIQSLGVGSGLALDDLVTQLLEAERKPKVDRLDAREETIEAKLSGIGKLKSKMDDFKKSVDDLRFDYELRGRKALASHPSETLEPFTADASNSATAGEYKIAVTQLASGSRVETANAVDGGFASSTSSVLGSGSGSLTFKIDSSGDSFSVNVTAGMTLEQLRAKINSNSNNFGVNASIINTGTADGGAKLVFSSTVTGAGNDLKIVNDNDLADLNRVATTDSSETSTYLTPVKSAQNAQVTIDGIVAESDSNKFENVLENVSFDVDELSSLDALGNPMTSTLEIGFDTEGVEKKIRDFVDNYNSLMTEINTLTKYGQSDLEEDGPLAGDFMARNIQSSLARIVSSFVPESGLGSLFQLGIAFDEDNKLKIGEFDEYGQDSGEERLAAALEDNFDEISNLFTGDNGIGSRLYDFTYEYTTFGGLLRTREQAYKDDKESILDQRERLELQMANYEDVLRSKYQNLDKTVAQLNSTGAALMAALG
ncbi:flagellar filament capping protein FliD [Neptunicella sp. SCSIO 80796]|uniref:flagellar filament capping protein FliD n=1 Tax=Neptunicella plasticusilytica TaxID=3117012 RepID=UPI003A4D7751